MEPRIYMEFISRGVGPYGVPRIMTRHAHSYFGDNNLPRRKNSDFFKDNITILIVSIAVPIPIILWIIKHWS